MMLGKNDKITFGKHNGKTIKELWDNYPEYIVWLDENINTISIDQHIVAECFKDKMDKEYDFEPDING